MVLNANNKFNSSSNVFVKLNGKNLTGVVKLILKIGFGTIEFGSKSFVKMT